MNPGIDRRTLLTAAIGLSGAALLGGEAAAGNKPNKKRVVCWSEGTAPKSVYPNDINTAIAEGLKPLKGWEVTTASLNDSEQGLPDSLLNEISCLVWWGHMRHDDVKDELVAKIVHRVKEEGMGFIGTHSASQATRATRSTSRRRFGTYSATPCRGRQASKGVRYSVFGVREMPLRTWARPKPWLRRAQSEHQTPNA
jgi:hypothetical protein